MFCGYDLSEPEAFRELWGKILSPGILPFPLLEAEFHPVQLHDNSGETFAQPKCIKLELASAHAPLYCLATIGNTCMEGELFTTLLFLRL